MTFSQRLGEQLTTNHISDEQMQHSKSRLLHLPRAPHTAMLYSA